MTTDPFTEAARAEAEALFLNSTEVPSPQDIGEHIAEWARTHLAAQEEAAIRALATTTAHTGQDIVEAARIMRAVAQEPTRDEVEAVARVIWRESTGRSRWESVNAERRAVYLDMARAALSAARAARRDEEKR